MPSLIVLATPPWSISHFISDISWLALSFTSFSFNWVKRSGNSAVHTVAKFALDSTMSCFFTLVNLPPSIAAVCLEDANNCIMYIYIYILVDKP